MSDTITPCLWFDGDAEAAVALYTDLIDGSRIVSTSHYGEGAPMPAGSVMSIDFELGGRSFLAINGGPMFQFSPAVSMIAYCDTQAQIDDLWERLSEGGETQQCGWLTDRFGLSWQIVPSILPGLLTGDQERCNRAMQALSGMVKLDIDQLERAVRPSPE